ncbi:hypothetical protein PCE1_003775 [Barthelona sp. PCE]
MSNNRSSGKGVADTRHKKGSKKNIGMVEGLIDEAKNFYNSFGVMSKRDRYQSGVNVALIGIGAWMLWNLMIVVTGSLTPGVVVLSGSMEPSFERGDILFLWNNKDYVQDDIVVYELPLQKIPIVHRILQTTQVENSTRHIVTKGDANPIDDRGLYFEGGISDFHLTPKNILGQVKAFIPFGGRITIIMADYPMLKYLLFLVMGAMAFVNKDR